VFSFGAVLYEMVTGKPPFKKGSGAETISAILSEAPAAPKIEDDAAASEVQRLLRKCLAKDPDARYQGVRDLVVDLRALRESIASGDSTSRSSVARSAVTPAASSRRSPLVWAGAAAVALAIGVGGWWATRDDASAPAATVADEVKRPAVAVLAFEVISGGPDIAWLGKGIPSLLVTGLAQTPDIEVIGNERLAEAAKQISAGALDSVDRSRLAEVSRRAGARFVVNGTIVQAGADLRIDARVEDLTTGAVKLAESVRGPDPLALADDLSARVRRGLNVQVAPESVRKVADMSSASVEAYRAFTTGAEAQRNNRDSDARRLFEEAIRLDPQFGLAYLHHSVLANRQGRPVEARQLLGKAAQHLDRMSERDGLVVRAELASDAGRVEESDRLLEGLLARYPDSEIGWVRLSRPRFSNPARAEAVTTRAIAALPLSPLLQNQHGYSLLHNGKIEDALRTFEPYVKLRPSEPNALDSLAEGLLVSGDISGALERYDTAIKGGYGGAHAGRVWTLAVAGRYQEALSDLNANPRFRGSPYGSFVLSRLGRYRESAAGLEAARQGAAENEATSFVVACDLMTAMLGLERGDCKEVGGRVAAAARAIPSLQPGESAKWQVLGELFTGTCDAREGRLASARQHLARARAQLESTSPAERWWVSALEGEIALAERDYDRAGRSFAGGEPPRKMFFSRSGVEVALSFLSNNLVLRDGRARAAAAQGKLDEAITLYRGLLTPGPQQKWTAMLDPLHVIALARVLDKAGQRDAARVEYQRFLELWKDADKELPQLAEARVALAR
jgi:tetratricopeptide (TPR) repeat protein